MTYSQVVSTMVSMMRRTALGVLLGLCLLAGLTPRAGAVSGSSYVVTRTADDTLPGSLRAAITAASGTGGTITFAIPNTDAGYSSAANTDTIMLSLGELDVTGSLTIAGPVAPAATVSVSSSTQAARVFSVTAGTVAFSSLTIQNGSSGQGGGDIQNAATLALTNCAVTGGTVGGSLQTPGGDILNTGTLTMTGCTVSGGGTFGGDGAGINNSGSGASLTMTGCTVSKNSTGFGGNGGGIANSGMLMLTGCTLSGNGVGGPLLQTISGGGLNSTGTATLNGCTLSGNNAGTRYGNGGGAASTGTLTLNNCLVTGNSAGFGGGLSTGGTLTLSACTISSNSAGDLLHNTGGAGGIVCGGTVQMTDCLVVNNSGLGVGGMSNGGTLTLIASTFASNSAYAGFGQTSALTVGGLYSGPATLINDIFYFDTGSANNAPVVSEIAAPPGTAGLTVTFSDVQGGYAGTGNLSADPQFVRNPDSSVFPADLGDEHLLLTSPAVHAGTNAPGVPLTDIEGTLRPTPPARPSMGAYEVPGSASGFSAQGGFLVTGTQNAGTGAQVVAKFLPGTTAVGSFTASVNLGDGSVVPGTIVPDPTTAGVFDVTVSHTYAAYGTFTVAVTISGPNNAPTATVTSTATIQPAQVAADVTSQVSILRGGLVYNRATKRYIQTVTITDTGAALAGLISLALDGLTPGAVLVSPTGTTQYAPPAGSPYQNVTATGLMPGASLSLVLQFTYAGTARFGYTPRVLAGPGAR